MSNGKKHRIASHARDTRAQAARGMRYRQRNPRVQAGRMAGPRVAPANGGGLEDAMRDMMLAAIPRLRAFAISLCGNVDRADDLVQETLLRALAHMDAFRPGSMIAWLITILRNVFLTEWRKQRWEIPDADG